jgi:hypothetical protein
MTQVRDILIIILVLLIFGVSSFLMLQPKEQEVKEVPVVIELSLPEIKAVSDTIYVDSIVYKERVRKEVLDPNPELLAKYKTSKDSIAKLNMYLNAIREHNYTTTFKDTLQDITVHSRTRGELLEQSLEYTFHKQTRTVNKLLSIPDKKHLEFYGMLHLGLPAYPLQQRVQVNGDDLWVPRNSGLTAKVSLFMKNKQDNLFGLSIDSDLKAYLGYGIKF